MTSVIPTDLKTTYAQVLLPIDFSPQSWKVLPLAKAMEQAFRVPLRLVHIDTSSPWVDERESELSLKASPDGPHVPVEVIAARSAADGIVRALGDDGASLLVMSSHGHTAAADLPFGSTTEAVLRSWQGAILVAGPHIRVTRPPLSRIALCVDPLLAGVDSFVDDAAAWARHFEVPVDVVYVHDYSLGADLDEMHAERTRIDRVVESLRDGGVAADAVSLGGSRIAHEITTYTDARPGTVIALATHARGLPTRLLLGSVAMAVLRHATSPVLLRRYASPE